MKMLADHPNTIFMGQAVADEGTAMSKTFRDVPREKLFEMPVMEDAQMGMAIGCALNGEIPICVYPRINFMLLAINQLCLHLDKLYSYSMKCWNPVVIVRTGIASPEPMNPGPQHLGDYYHSLSHMLDYVRVIRVNNAAMLVSVYRDALKVNKPSVIIEQLGLYN